MFPSSPFGNAAAGGASAAVRRSTNNERLIDEECVENLTVYPQEKLVFIQTKLFDIISALQEDDDTIKICAAVASLFFKEAKDQYLGAPKIISVHQKKTKAALFQADGKAVSHTRLPQIKLPVFSITKRCAIEALKAINAEMENRTLESTVPACVMTGGEVAVVTGKWVPTIVP